MICCIPGQFQYLDNYSFIPSGGDETVTSVGQGRPRPGFKVDDYNDTSGVGNLTPFIQVDSGVYSTWLVLNYANGAQNAQIIIWDAFKSQQKRL